MIIGISPPGPGWTFLGQGTASTAVRTSLVSWVGVYQQLWFEHYVSGYSGSAIARLIVGPAAGLSETGTTFTGTLVDTVGTASPTVPTTTNSAVWSIPGWPLAGTVGLGAFRRHGWHWVKNIATDVKSMFGQGNYSGTAPTTSPSKVEYCGLFSDATNSIQQAELAVYAGNTNTTVAATTMNSGSYLIAWGRNIN